MKSLTKYSIISNPVDVSISRISAENAGKFAAIDDTKGMTLLLIPKDFLENFEIEDGVYIDVPFLAHKMLHKNVGFAPECMRLRRQGLYGWEIYYCPNPVDATSSHRCLFFPSDLKEQVFKSLSKIQRHIKYKIKITVSVYN